MDIERILFEQLNDDDIKAERKEKQSERVDVGEQETVGQPAQLGKQKAAFIRFCHALLCFFDGGRFPESDRILVTIREEEKASDSLSYDVMTVPNTLDRIRR